MTTIILDPIQKQKLVPIELCYYLNDSFEVEKHIPNTVCAANFKFVELIAKNYCRNKTQGEPDFDLIFLYNDEQKRRDGVLYAGHWNDGV